MAKPITSSRLEALTQIWQEILQVPSISQEDNFFELGGDSALAIHLFTKITDVFGKRLPPVMIYHAPTISLQSELLDEFIPQNLSPLVLLKSGCQQPSVFIAPGLGGGPAEFFQLVKYMKAPNAIYGLQPRGIEGFDDPCDRIEDMAEFYLRAILESQPKGPYILIGYSLGGLVALEMARGLTLRGYEVALLGMLDSYPDIRALDPASLLRLLLQRLRRRLATSGQSPRSDVRLGGLPSADAISSFAPAFDRVREAAYFALRRYRPSFYAGAVRFVRASDVTEFPADPKPVWSRFLPRIQVETVPGDHLGMLTSHYLEMAAVLDRYLEKGTSF